MVSVSSVNNTTSHLLTYLGLWIKIKTPLIFLFLLHVINANYIVLLGTYGIVLNWLLHNCKHNS